MKLLKNYPAKPFSYVYERVAAKKHKCAYCNNPINVGDIYFHKHGIEENHKFYDVRYCTPCYDTKNI